MVIGICDHINFWAWHYKDMFQNKKYWNVLNQGSFVAFFYQRINFFCSCPIQSKSKRFSSISYLFFCSIALSKYLYVILKKFWLCEQFDCSYFGSTIKQWGYITPGKCMCKKETSTKWLSQEFLYIIDAYPVLLEVSTEDSVLTYYTYYPVTEVPSVVWCSSKAKTFPL